MSDTLRRPSASCAPICSSTISVPGREVIQNRVEIAPGAPFVRHKHPGEELAAVRAPSQAARLERIERLRPHRLPRARL